MKRHTPGSLVGEVKNSGGAWDEFVVYESEVELINSRKKGDSEGEGGVAFAQSVEREQTITLHSENQSVAKQSEFLVFSLYSFNPRPQRQRSQ